MNHRDVELLAIGGGPANLALAVALEELAPDLAANSLVIEKSAQISWQQGLLFPDAESQVSFLKDLVTQRNPRSKFTFVNYLHSAGRLTDFINMGSFWPYRQEVSEYHRWVADQLEMVRLECSRRCVSVEPYRAHGQWPAGWLTRLADGSVIRSRHIVFGTGRDMYIPPVFDQIRGGGSSTAPSTGGVSPRYPAKCRTTWWWSAVRRARPRCSTPSSATCPIAAARW